MGGCPTFNTMRDDDDDTTDCGSADALGWVVDWAFLDSAVRDEVEEEVVEVVADVVVEVVEREVVADVVAVAVGVCLLYRRTCASKAYPKDPLPTVPHTLYS